MNNGREKGKEVSKEAKMRRSEGQKVNVNYFPAPCGITESLVFSFLKTLSIS